MRLTVAITIALSTLFIGVIAISEQGQLVEGTTDTQAENTSYNAATGVLEGLTAGGGESLIWFGVAAIVLVACGLLYAMAVGGGR